MKTGNDLAIAIERRNDSGRKAEADGDAASAIQYYEQNIKEDYAGAFAFERLMILYRKAKKHKDELRVIKRGIRVFTEQQQNLQKRMQGTRKNKRQVSELSHLFMTRAGLKDKKGNSAYYPEPINKWMKRKDVVEKNIKVRNMT